MRHAAIATPLNPMTDYSIGIDDHYAWANLVSVTVTGSDDVLVDKRRVELLDQSLPASPFHHDTRHMPLGEAERLVREVTASANDRALSALTSLMEDLAPPTCLGIAIRVPPLPELPTNLEEVHANARVMNRADGMIYHQALTRAAVRLNLPISYFEKATVLSLAAHARGTTAQDLEQRLKAFGTTYGRPWRQSQVLACAGAILAHISAGAVRLENGQLTQGRV